MKLYGLWDENDVGWYSVNGIVWHTENLQLARAQRYNLNDIYEVHEIDEDGWPVFEIEMTIHLEPLVEEDA